ncbi:5673_t:CDS:1, partial [Gigaspora rosea]
KFYDYDLTIGVKNWLRQEGFKYTVGVKNWLRRDGFKYNEDYITISITNTLIKMILRTSKRLKELIHH